VAGAFAAGVLLGVAESLTTAYVSVRWATAVPTLLIPDRADHPTAGLFTPADPNRTLPHDNSSARAWIPVALAALIVFPLVSGDLYYRTC